MQSGDKIIILPSIALTELKLQSLEGVQATIVAINGQQGCWVRLSFEYLGETEWYIPYSSIGI